MWQEVTATLPLLPALDIRAQTTLVSCRYFNRIIDGVRAEVNIALVKDIGEMYLLHTPYLHNLLLL